MAPGIYGADTGMTRTATDARATAFGFGQRRSWVFSAWWYPAVLAMAGTVHAGLAAALGQSAEIGVVMMVLGGIFAALGWACTAWPRFTRKPPKPASDIPRVEQGIRITPGMIRTMLIASALGIVALVVLTPMGGSVEAVPLLGMLVAVTLGVAAGLAYTGRLMKNSAEVYSRWLDRR
ncbi:hypothetical protein PY310_01165 [Pseudarthrobacter sp. H3Y2-7]|jgi:hypothetical protein|uniref:hypothetical protein n=1 Tax=Pseudarthrobacter naphthalenicus TaxID=3031328 RepID=UPI0023AE9B42|nr:hypothetical protein [Pseudarthrobacter sp. H3Y2-7]MDE8667189.1 hypothetical protein [Pseudarthrobacter sp. H3Y2-7]